MENILEEIKAQFREMPLFELLIMAGLGLALMLFGYRVKKLAFFIIWFLIGYNLMMFLMPIINNMVPQIAGSELYQILLPIAGGLLLALLGFSIEKVCLAGICFFLVMMITVQYFGTSIPTLAIGAIIGVVAGAAATTLMKPAIIIATALAGAYALTVALLNIFPVLDQQILYFPLIGAFALLGAIFQFSTTKKVG
ncbi:DUF4203 domain-containing protein [Candidatus Saccharibacteria bacterium]|nr:DUF4203 domain-containing protein [Candidatus Saccharibacteria bacterium]